MIEWPAADPSSPYFCHEPTLISFSGGRTSAFMLWLVLCAHGGALPDYVVVAFANTGKEDLATLRFVHEVGVRWGVSVVWLQRTARGGFEVVGFNSAARAGEPFDQLIDEKQYLPNSQMRYCTIELKIRVMIGHVRSLGWSKWKNMVGLRADEIHRVYKAIERNKSGKEPFTTLLPMATVAGGMVTKRDVLVFWWGSLTWQEIERLRSEAPALLADLLPQGFDLEIHSADGNCDLCFLKRRATKVRRIRRDPSSADWWSAAEKRAKCSVKINGEANARFDRTESVDDLRRSVLASPTLELEFAPEEEDDDADAECGFACVKE